MTTDTQTQAARNRTKNRLHPKAVDALVGSGYDKSEAEEAADIVLDVALDDFPDLLKQLIIARDRITVHANDAGATWNDWPGSYDIDAAIAKATGKD